MLQEWVGWRRIGAFAQVAYESFEFFDRVSHIPTWCNSKNLMGKPAYWIGFLALFLRER
jgi:hypothetical protein